MPNYYPPTGYSFRVRFEGIGGDQDTSFQEVSGLTTSVGSQTYQEGGENRFAHRFPKPLTYGNLTMKRGLLLGSGLIQWFQDIQESFRFETHDISVYLLNDERQEIAGWNFIQAYPVKWSFDTLNATQSSIFAENLEFSYQYYTRVNNDSLTGFDDLKRRLVPGVVSRGIGQVNALIDSNTKKHR